MSEEFRILRIGGTDYEVTDFAEEPNPSFVVLDLDVRAASGLEGHLIPPNTRIRLSGQASAESHPSRVATRTEFEVLD